MADCLALGEDLGQVLRAEHVAQRRRRQEVRRVAEKDRGEVGQIISFGISFAGRLTDATAMGVSAASFFRPRRFI